MGNQALIAWDTAKLNDMSGMFLECARGRGEHYFHFPMLAGKLLKRNQPWGTVVTAAEYELSFRIIPKSHSPYWVNVMRVTWTTGNLGTDGDRFSAVWFEPNSLKSLFHAGNRGNPEDSLRPSVDMLLDHEYRVKVVVVEGVLHVHVDGESWQKKLAMPPTSGKRATVYAGDSHEEPA